jgi:hypothetical protein
MDLVTVLGIVSLVFVATVTWRESRRAAGVGQSPRSAMLEAWVNIGIGFSVNFVANLFLLPLVGAQLTASSNFWLGCTYTAISIVRQYVIRRHFNARLHAARKST